MENKRIPIVSIVGRSNTGKTTLVVKLIPLLKARGLRVATIKHHPHDFEIDKEGKDTYRHKKAGAVLSLIASPGKIAMVKDVEEDLGVQKLVDQFINGVDLVINEGHKKEKLPKIEVYQDRGEPPVCFDDPDLIAIMSDTHLDAPVPVFKRDDAQSAVDLIVEVVLGKEQG
jgi:molybdopterin-guanine dinucleotide biosynthesis adapter protein